MQPNRTFTPYLLLVIAFFMTLNQTLMVTALPNLMKELNVQIGLAQWVTTGYILFLGLVIPLSAILMEKYTNRFLTMSALSLFLVGSILGFYSQNIYFILLARMLQAIGSGILLPLMQYSFLVTFSKENRGRTMGLVMLAQSVAPALGPVLSGILVTNYSWRALFFMMIPVSLILIFVTIMKMENFNKTTDARIKPSSMIYSTLGFGGILVGSGIMNQSLSAALVILVVGITFLFLFIYEQTHIENPVLNFSVFTFRVFSVSTLFNVIAFALVISTEMLLPIYVVDVKHQSATIAGLVLLPGVIAFSLFSPIAGRLYDKYKGKILSVIGFALLFLTSIAFLFITAQTSLAFLIVTYMIRLIGTSLLITPMMTAGMNALPEKLLAHGTAMSNTMNQLLAAIFASFIVSLISFGQDLHGGLHASFVAITIISFIALCISLFSKALRVKQVLK